jgi:hypothetical protein
MRVGRRQHGTKAKRFAGVLVALVVLGGSGVLGARFLIPSLNPSGSDDATQTVGDDDETDEPTDSPSEPTPSDTPSPTEPPAEPVAVDLQEAQYYDPEGSTPENPDQVGNAIDGDPATSWGTLNYYDPLELQKSGVGLYVDLGEPVPVAQVEVLLTTSDSDVELRVLPEGSGDVPSEIDGWERVELIEGAGGTATFEIDDPMTTQYVLVWFTRLPQSGSEYKGGIAEVSVQGSPPT